MNSAVFKLNWKKLSGLFILTLCLAALNAQSIAASNANSAVSKSKMGSLDVSRWTTANGMQVLFAPTSELPIVDIRLVFDAGSARDAMDQVLRDSFVAPKAGLATLTNGLVFEGSKGISANDIAKGFEDLGVQYGNSSHRDMAVIDLRSLSDKPIINKAMDMFNQILAEPLFDEKVLERERNKLLVALKLGQQNPSTKASLAFYQALYSNASQQHPYASPSSGDEKSLANIKRQDLVDFYQRYYVAANAVFAIVGDLSLSDAQAMAERLSNTLGKGKHAPSLPSVSYPDKGKQVRLHHDSTQTTIVLGQPVLKRGDKDYYALYLANHVLGGSGFSSRLVKEVRVKRGLTYGVSSYFSLMRAEGPFQIALTTKNESANEAIEVINNVLDKFIKEGPTADEIEQSKLNISGSFPLRTASNKNIVEHLAVIGFYNLSGNYLEDFLNNIQALTREDIINAFNRRVKPEMLSTIIVGPKKS